jgi:tRNA modification GTPase
MDFASGELDDVDVVPPTQIAAALVATVAPLKALATTYARGRLLRDGAAIALIGPPNAGKSSLFNCLLQRERAIVTATPGTTRDTVEESLALAGIPLRLIDTAGLRDTPHIDEAEQQGIMRTREALADADLILLIHDATQPLSPEELALAATLSHRPHLYINNKIDLLQQDDQSHPLLVQPQPKAERPNPLSFGTLGYPEASASALMAEDQLGFSPQGLPSFDRQPLQTSAITGQGLDTLRSAILAQLGVTSVAETGALNTLRQHEAITTTLAALETAATANASGLPHELLLLDLHTALRSLDSLTGLTTPDDILARIFSTFCIGK